MGTETTAGGLKDLIGSCGQGVYTDPASQWTVTDRNPAVRGGHCSLVDGAKSGEQAAMIWKQRAEGQDSTPTPCRQGKKLTVYPSRCLARALCKERHIHKRKSHMFISWKRYMTPETS